MQNLDQIRAAAALAAVNSKDLDRSAISRLPGLILSSGLLAAAAFCEADGGGDNREHLKKAMASIADHLRARGIIPSDAPDIKGMISSLSRSDALTLQRATTEALALMSYMKRFARKDKSGESQS